MGLEMRFLRVWSKFLVIVELVAGNIVGRLVIVAFEEEIHGLFKGKLRYTFFTTLFNGRSSLRFILIELIVAFIFAIFINSGFLFRIRTWGMIGGFC
jgi:hypothetical protein